MHFIGSIFPTAYAAFDAAAFGGIVNPVIEQIVYPVIYVIFSLAVVVFVYGVVEMIIKDDADARKKGRYHILAGVIGMFIMVSAWGIIYLVSDTLKGVKNQANSSTDSNDDWDY